jgi:hypothetical protein
LRLRHPPALVVALVAVVILLGLAVYVRIIAPGQSSTIPEIQVPAPLSSPGKTTPVSSRIPTVGVTVAPTPTPSRPTRVYLPGVPNNLPSGPVVANAPVPTATPIPAPATPAPTPKPTPTRGPIRITKLGLGVYDSGGAMLSDLDEARPSVILLMDPTVDFAKQVRQMFPKAFIIGRIYATSQPLDNPAARGTAFADRVAVTAVPLKGIVNAWMSYNEVSHGEDPSNLIAYNTFQVAFAHQLQDHYGIAAVAGNDGPRSVPANLYPKYFAGAIEASRYFGVHAYPDDGIRSLRDPKAASQIFYYRQIHQALEAAGIKSGPFIITEVGLYNGWRGVTDDTSMAQDFIWYADQINPDPYVLGMTVFGLFTSDRWAPFNIAGSIIPQMLGDYNTVH